MLKTVLTTALLALNAMLSTAQAETRVNPAPVVVNKASCSKIAETTQPFILVLNSGDDLIESITQCAKAAKLQGASISGLGQLHDPTLAYFTSNPKDKPKLTAFPGYYELASLNSNVSANGKNYYTHAHAAVADQQFHGITGHVDKAKVGLTAEITFVPFSGPVRRTVDAKTGFGPLITH